jgi:FAD/FMN-containing dehydrogenase
MGKHAMAIDNLLSAEVVLASGDVVTASAPSEPDLFWAIRGGGGNYRGIPELPHRHVRLGD